MTTKQAREILGTSGEQLTDEEITEIMRKMKILAEACYNQIALNNDIVSK